MSSWAELRTVVALKSGAPPLELKPDDVVRRLGFNISDMRHRGYDAAILGEHEIINQQLSRLATDPTAGQYLLHLLPVRSYKASGWNVFACEDVPIYVESLQHGYLPICGWGDYGDELLLHKDHGLVYADTFMWNEHSVCYDVCGKSCIEPYSHDSLARATQRLSSDVVAFFEDFLQDKLERHLDELRKFGTWSA